MKPTQLVAPRSSTARRVVAAVLLGSVLLTALVSGAFLMLGGRFWNISTPSMGTYAPVGTLVLSMPTDYQSVHVGQVIFFTPPGGHETYFHRVVARTATGFKTEGDLNGSVDPWVVGPHDIAGEEIFRALYLGWLLPVLPILLGGGIVVHVYTRFFMDRYLRFPAQVMGWSLVLSLSNWMLHPFMRMTFLSQVVSHHHARIRLVSTGILPLDANAVNGESSVAQLGHLVILHTSKPGSDGRFHVDITPHLEWWGWVVGIALLILPFMLCLGYTVLARRRGWDYIYDEVIPEGHSEGSTSGEGDLGVVSSGKPVPLLVTLEELLADAGLDERSARGRHRLDVQTN